MALTQGKPSLLPVRILLIILLCTLSFTAKDQEEGNEWVDPFDMLNFDPVAKKMKKPAEPASYDNVATKRREYTQDTCQTELMSCIKQVEDQEKQQPTCSPVFKRFLSRLLKEMQRVGVPSDSADLFYDAKIKLSKKTMVEIQTFLEGEDRWRTGPLDNAISQILVDLKVHDYEAWKWKFEDTFGVELDTLLKIGLFVLIIVATISTQLWSVVSWFVQFKRMFAVCFFVSIIWNWFYLYKIAFAEHQNNIVKMEGFNEKCTGVKQIDWSDSLKEWFRSTWTLQDDPCKRYYEVLMVNPILLVTPTKAISVTITTFITEPLKHFGQGISEFLRALLKDLPVTLQIPVLLTIVLAIVVCIYGSVQAAFQHGIMVLIRGPRRDPPPPELVQPHAHPHPHPQLQPQPQPLQMIEERDPFREGDAPPQQRALNHRADEARLYRNQVYQRRPNRPQEEPVQLIIETLRTADPQYSEDETDAERPEVVPEAENMAQQNPFTEPDSENQQEPQEPPEAENVSSVGANKTKSELKPTQSDPSQSKDKPSNGNENLSETQQNRDVVAPRLQPGERQPIDEHPEASPEDIDSSIQHSVNFKAPVQETRPLVD